MHPFSVVTDQYKTLLTDYSRSGNCILPVGRKFF